jgi:hypothetical protein
MKTYQCGLIAGIFALGLAGCGTTGMNTGNADSNAHHTPTDNAAATDRTNGSNGGGADNSMGNNAGTGNSGLGSNGH